MSGKKTGKGVSLTEQEWAFVLDRTAELKLKTLAEYFQLLIDLDQTLRPRLQMHSDNSLHLYGERQDLLVAEPSAGYGIKAPMAASHLGDALAEAAAEAQPGAKSKRPSRARRT